METSSDLEGHRSSPEPYDKKRKRDAQAFEELEVDVNASEPLSKKAERKLKRQKSTGLDSKTSATSEHPDGAARDQEQSPESTSKRSEHGIWIGNLPWNATKLQLRDFLTKKDAVRDEDITRVHLPTTKRAAAPKSSSQGETQNKGFAYVDFVRAECVAQALALSDTLMSGRRVLIKDARNFEGRPQASAGSTEFSGLGKPPNKRIFVGNLHFSVDESELRSHFSKCGQIASLFLATFEDSGKCKGYGWIAFDDIEAAKSAVRGWVEIEKRSKGTPDEKPELKIKKWWLHRLNGTKLRIEFAEDDALRYKKRFGKREEAVSGTVDTKGDIDVKEQDGASDQISRPEKSQTQRKDKKQRVEKAAPKSSTPTSVTVAQRLTGSLMHGAGKKTVSS